MHASCPAHVLYCCHLTPPSLTIAVRAHTEMMMGAQWCCPRCGRRSAVWPAATSWSRSSMGDPGAGGSNVRRHRMRMHASELMHRMTPAPAPPLTSPLPSTLPGTRLRLPSRLPLLTPLSTDPYPPTYPFPPINRYLPIGGLKDFNVESIKLAYGDHADVIRHGQVAVVQSLSGTGSCRLMAEFQVRGERGCSGAVVNRVKCLMAEFQVRGGEVQRETWEGAAAFFERDGRRRGESCAACNGGDVIAIVCPSALLRPASCRGARCTSPCQRGPTTTTSGQMRALSRPPTGGGSVWGVDGESRRLERYCIPEGMSVPVASR